MSVRKISPLLDAMELGECFSSHDGVSCYAITHPESGREFVLKYLSVPASQEQVEALLLTGAYASKEEADDYYRKEAEALVREAEERKKLLECPFILPFLGVQMEKKEDGVGYDVYAVLPKRNSLKDYLEENAISHLRGINMGIDLCAALSALREQGYVHGNLKPGNVYFSDTGRFLLGDFGLISTRDMQYTVLPEQYRSSYTAPELRNIIGGFNKTVDIYSLGMILYRIYNGNHAPFEDEKTPSKAADTRRLEGDKLPAPLYADYELTEIIQKACAYDPTDRYQTPDDMRIALEQYMQRNAVSDHLIVPPLVAEDGPLNPEDREEQIEPVRANDVEKLDENFKKAFSPDSRKKKKKDGKKNPQKDAPQSSPALADNTPMLTAERRRIAEKAARHRRRRRRAWIAFAVLMALLITGIALYEFTDLGHGLYHYFVKVEQLAVSDVTTDSMKLHLRASVEEDQFQGVCEDAYGNAFRAGFTDGVATFTGLNPGTQYTLHVELSGRHKLSGNNSVTAATIPQTEILTFTAADGTEPGSVRLDLVVKDDATMPETWTLHYGRTGAAAQETAFSGTGTQINGLDYGAEYSFRLVGSDDFRLVGQTEVRFVPQQLVEILSFTAAPGETPEEVLLEVSVLDEATAPASWTLRYGKTGGEETETTFEGASLQLQGLELGTEYSFRLVGGEHQTLSGTTELTYLPTQPVTAEGLVLDRMAEGTAYVRWTCTSELPEVWELSCTDADGNALPAALDEPQQAEDGWLCTASIPGIVSGEDYTLTLRALGLREPLTLTLRNDEIRLDEFTAELTDGELHLHWTADRQPESGWIVEGAFGSGATLSETVEGDSLTLAALPETHYVFTLRSADGAALTGETETSISTPATDRFSGFGVAQRGNTLGTYYVPAKENWTFSDLGGGTISYPIGGEIIFVVTAGTTPQDTDEAVTVHYVVRDSRDEIVHAEAETLVWNEMWDGSRWIGTIPWLPAEIGRYSFSIYINSELMGTIPFSMRQPA